MATSTDLETTDAATKAGTGEQADTRQQPRSLLDLPDELLEPILRTAFQFERDEKREGTAVPLSRIMVNKRIWAAGLPLWLERIRFPYLDARYSSTGDAFFGGLLGHSYHWSNVRSVEVQTVNAFPSLAVGTITSFASLSALTITESSKIPRRLTQGLSKLRELMTLTVLGTACLEDVAFDLRKTTIRKLAGSHSAALQQLLQGGKGSQLEELELCVSNLSYYTAIPWRTLRVLRLIGEEDGTVPSSGFDSLLQSLFQAAKLISPLPLLTFELAVGDTSTTSPDRRAARYGVLDYIVRTAAPSFVRLSQLAFVDASSLQKAFPPSVETLELEGSAQMASGDNLEGLHHLLAQFPSIASLTLLGFPFHVKSTSLVADFKTDTFSAFGMRYPAFAALFTFLRKTNVLRFRYRPATEPLELRCTRSRPGKGFTVEVVRVLNK
ncbi:hypothetical protein JCM3770_002948 [Rhodotorula araucariae]